MYHTPQYVTLTELRKHPKNVLAKLSNGAITILMYNQPQGILLSLQSYAQLFPIPIPLQPTPWNTLAPLETVVHTSKEMRTVKNQNHPNFEDLLQQFADF